MNGHRATPLAARIAAAGVRAPGRLLALAAAASLSLVQAAPRFELPFPARFEPVIEQGEIEGQPVHLARFRSDLALDDAVRAVQLGWRGAGGVAVVEARSGPWRLLSTFGPEGFSTLQLRSSHLGGTEGVLSLWPPARSESNGSPRAPGVRGTELLPPGSTVLRSFGAVDAGRRSETVVATVEGNPGWVAQAIGEALGARGFTRDPVIRPGAARGEAASYRRGALEVAFTVSDAGGGRSGVVLHVTGAVR